LSIVSMIEATYHLVVSSKEHIELNPQAARWSEDIRKFLTVKS